MIYIILVSYLISGILALYQANIRQHLNILILKLIVFLQFLLGELLVEIYNFSCSIMMCQRCLIPPDIRLRA